MFRLNEIKLPLNHAEGDLRAAILAKLRLEEADLIDFSIFKRSYDARKKSNIELVYQLDIELTPNGEAAVLAGEFNPSTVRPSPDTNYYFPIHANDDFPSAEQQRPIVIGFGPCGILAALLLAQMGLKPIVLERGRDVRRRT
ncbi:MAG: putative FAD-dependent dehydrogenase, partial [Bacteroidia bacterium]